jgi:ABC-type multidrug transport system ATPase subunit
METPIAVPEKVSLRNNPPVFVEWRNLEYIVKVKQSPALHAKFTEKLKGALTFKKKDKSVLYPMSGYVAPGQVLAVMGPSGAGKTSFLNILAQRVKDYKGEILINDKPIDKTFRSLSAYVQQDDVLMGNLTVRETLRYAALLRLPGNTPMRIKMQKVDQVMDELGLSKSADIIVGIPGLVKGISGGERKRLAIAVELLTEPSVLFLDEPTSGLDAKTALNVIETVNKIAKAGRTVILTIHQPRSDIYQLFDQLLLLAKGRVAYMGSAKDAPAYFASTGFPCPVDFNPAEYFIDLISESTSGGQKVEFNTCLLPPNISMNSLIEQYELKSTISAKGLQIDDVPKQIVVLDRTIVREIDVKRIDYLLDYYQRTKFLNYTPPIIDEKLKQTNLTGISKYTSPWIAQFIVLLTRSFMNLLRDRMFTFARIFQNVVMALLVGLIFFRLSYDQTSVRNREGAMFFILLTNCMNNMFSSLVAFLTGDKGVLLRERGAKMYRVSPYFLARWFAEVPHLLFFTTLFGVISYWMVGFNPSADRFFFFLLIMNVTCLCSQAMGMFIASAVPTQQVAFAIGPLLITSLMIFAGFYINVGSIPPWFIWVYWISFFHYGFEALIINEFRGVIFQCPSPPQVCMFPTGESVIQNLSMTNPSSQPWIDIAIMIGILLIVRLLTYLILRFKPGNKPKGG